jgi:hypothetical protein
MKRTIHTLVALAILAVASTAAASEKGEKPHAQQDKFAHCAHESKGLKGEERSKFMSECLKGHAADGAAEKPHPAAHRESSQHGRMKACNDEAHKKDLHGEERRAFMSTCLKG